MRRTRPAAALAAVVLIALGAAGVWLTRSKRSPPLASASCRGCNLLLITIDTLRADRVGAFGSARGLTPTIDRLAAGGLRLTRAYTSAPLTLPAHASLLTSSSPPVHGVRNNSLFRLGANPPTLATVLKAAGYRTGAFVGAFVLDARFGLGRGFDVYDDRYGDKAIGDPGEGPERRAEDVVAPAQAWILGSAPVPSASPKPPAPSPWFAWVHLYDPHAPYSAPEPFASRHEPYDAEVAYADAALASLIDALAARGELDRTLVVFTADHGESLGEHGEPMHGVFVYEATMKVPAFVWAGERIGSRSYGGVARLIDLAPTAAALLGVAVPPAFEGRSLLPAVDSGAGDGQTPPAYVEAMDANLTRNWAPLTGLVSGAFKLIDLPAPELYDLASDPGERVNLFTREAERARVLTSLLSEQAAQFASRASPVARASLDTEARQRLQALGYATSAADPAARVYGDADDPKMLMPAANDLDRALASFRQGGGASTMAAAQAIVTAHPGFTTAYGVLASMQRDSGDLAAAIATLEAVMRRGIADQSVMVVLGSYLQEAGALDKAAALLQAVIASHPDYADAYNGLGVVYSRQGRHADARTAFRKVIELDPTAATAYQNLAIDELASGDLTAAAADLTRALALDPRLAGAHNALAAVHLRQGRASDAIAEWQAALKANPRLWDALFNLGTVLYDAGRRDEARPYLERFVREAPRSRYAADIKRLEVMIGRQW
jgi:arylsulfatase A-like enzyme/Tfp pilus assembly protein PilF